MVMLATARDSEAPAESRDLFARATVVALGPLSPTEIASMADACVGGVCPPDDVAQVQRSSGGLPLLVEDLLGETSRFDDLISRRVRDLPIEAQQVVIAAALIGERFAPADVAAALAISPTAVGAQLATAADAQLAEFALGVAWLIASGGRTRGNIEKVVAGSSELTALKPLLGDATVSLNVSVGGGLWPEHGRTISELVRYADEAMYADKARGRRALADEGRRRGLHVDDRSRQRRLGIHHRAAGLAFD